MKRSTGVGVGFMGKFDGKTLLLSAVTAVSGGVGEPISGLYYVDTL